MGKTESKYPVDVFTSLDELLRMERLARTFHLRGSKHKVNSILGGKHTSKLRGRGLDFEEVRAYVKGDDIRNIDWKVTARTQETHTRVYSEEKEKPALIVVDQTKSMFFGSEVRTKAVVAAEIAALMAFRVLKEGDRVGGVVFADQGTDIIFPKRDRKNILRFLDKIVDRNHELLSSETVDFEKAFKDVVAKINNIVTHDFLVVVISDFHRYSDNVIKYLSRIGLHNDVLLIKVFDPMERDIPADQFIAGDGRYQIDVHGQKQSIRSNFESGFDEDFNAFQAELKKHRIPILSLHTVLPLEDQIKELLKSKR